MHRNFTKSLPCGCDHGHFCPEAEGLFRELSRWLLNMSHPTAVELAAKWDAHFEECTCDPDPRRESATCPACVAINQTEEIPY